MAWGRHRRFFAGEGGGGGGWGTKGGKGVSCHRLGGKLPSFIDFSPGSGFFDKKGFMPDCRQ